ncbi:MAG: rubrerythrin [Planctomycetes bacterium]|nr:rubrerythrin [Planctomycetota bacterium]
MSIGFSADEVFKIGMEVELNGKAFYDAALGLCEDEEPKETIKHLRDEEGKHYASFAKMRDQLPPEAKAETVFDPDGQMAAYLKALADSRVFTSESQAADIARNCRSAREILQVALRFEKDSVLMFQALKEGTKPEWGQEKIDYLIGAEMEHIRKINALLEKLAG